MEEHNLPKTYDFKSVEERIYKMWEENGYFAPVNDPKDPEFDPSRKPYVISIPPPNVTGILHTGHAMFVSIEDLMIRYHRMKGEPTLWVPGTDHAGIATQLQVERNIVKTENTTREAIGREEFLKRAWKWKDDHHGTITKQIRRMGASLDWPRERFTLDDGLSAAVKEAFVQLYNKGLIYRGPRLINWSPGLKTAVSDLEVEYSEEPGKLFFFKYPVAGSDDFLPVATTRPETILGDTAVAVHPDDDRFKQFVGRKAVVPGIGREIPIIADEYVDMEFGTGALKITPGHDPHDYEIGERHKLNVVSIMDKNACINENGGKYAGLDRFEAREKLWADMEADGLVIKVEPYTLNVPRSQRGGEIIEPMISTQWFVNIKPLAEPALKAVQDGDVVIVPDHFNKVYSNWMENIQDWCISRQLWWGHRIPVWYGPDNEIFCAHSEEEALILAEKHYGEPTELIQDPDVLDTWFSSSLWPFSTLGWPEKTPDYDYFYPTSMLETGYDILFFWVARMMMMGIEFTGKAPFNTIYLHGLIRDEKGRKMSKSLGNVINPLEVMDEMGTDALRFTYLVGSTPGKDMNLSLKKVESNRNFNNKIWNGTRLILSLLEKAPTKAETEPMWTLADRWIQARTAQVIRSAERLFQSHQYGEAGRQIYEFFWNEFADWYLEIAKIQIDEGGDSAYYTCQQLVKTLDTSLRHLHPFIPFVTEELWGYLKAAASKAGFGEWEEALIVAQWPEPEPEEAWEAESVKQFADLTELVRSIRNIRAEKQVKPKQLIPGIISAGDSLAMLEAERKSLAALAKLDDAELKLVDKVAEKPEGHVAIVSGAFEVYLPLSGLVDEAEEKERLTKTLAETEDQIRRLEKLLSSPFAQKAPPQVVEKEKGRLAEFVETAEKIKQQLANL